MDNFARRYVKNMAGLLFLTPLGFMLGVLLGLAMADSSASLFAFICAALVAAGVALITLTERL